MLRHFHGNQLSYKMRRGCPFFWHKMSSGAHSACTRYKSTHKINQCSTPEYRAHGCLRWVLIVTRNKLKRHLYSVSKRLRANGSVHSETDKLFWVNFAAVVSSQWKLNRVFLMDSRVLLKILGTCSIICIEQCTCQAILSKTFSFLECRLEEQEIIVKDWLTPVIWKIHSLIASHNMVLLDF